MNRILLKAVVTVTDEGTFEAVISAASIDREKDIVDPDGMVRALRKWVPTGKKIPLAWQHSSAAEDQIGYIDPASAKVVDGEVVAGGWIDQSTPVGADAWRLVKAGTLGFSFGYLTLDSEPRDDGGRLLKELDVFEVTATPTPMNNDTRVLAYKSASELQSKPPARRRPALTLEELRAKAVQVELEAAESLPQLVEPDPPMSQAAYNERVAMHEARHAAACLMLGLPIVSASVTPDETTLGRVDWWKWGASDLGEMTDHEVRQAAIVSAVGALDGDPSSVWPPTWPSEKGATTDERHLAAYAKRLGLDFEGWTQLATEARELVTEPRFGLLRDAIAARLLSDGTLNSAQLKQIQHVVETGRGPTYNVGMLTRPLVGRGQFTGIIDIYPPTKAKPRIRRGAFEPTIKALQASGQPIALTDVAGDVIGEVNPADLMEKRTGLLVKATLFMERNQAVDVMRSARRGALRVEFDDTLTTLALRPSTKAHAARKTAPVRSEFECLERLEVALKPTVKAPTRDTIALQVELGTAHPARLAAYDDMTRVLKNAPTVPADELKARARRVAAEFERNRT